jgi:DNA invertase Pin-like site-specific DNA recombinase
MTSNNEIRYFIYARKSSESSDRQVQSLEDQINAMRGVAHRLNVPVVGVFQESKSAKAPGKRPLFADMVKRIEKGEAQGILCWQLNRLSRNPEDSGRLQWMLQSGKLLSIQTHDRPFLPKDNALLFAVEAGTNNQFIIDLKENTKRGIDSKLSKGMMPCKAPVGYQNTVTETQGENYIVPDPARFPIIRRAWDMMLTGNYGVDEIRQILTKEYGLTTLRRKNEGGMPLSKSAMYVVFSNPFYVGNFRYRKHLHKGIHQPMITQEEFERVQQIIKKRDRGYVHHAYAYNCLIKCGECAGTISVTEKQKLIKGTGKKKTYTLYYCINARKSKGTKCSQTTYTNAETIEEAVEREILKFTIMPELRDWALAVLDEQTADESATTEAIVEFQQKRIAEATKALTNLTTMRMNDMIEDAEFVERKTALKKRDSNLRDENAGNTGRNQYVDRHHQRCFLVCDRSMPGFCCR